MLKRRSVAPKAFSAVLCSLVFVAGAFGDDFALGTDFKNCIGADTTNCGELYEINMDTLATRFITNTGLTDVDNQPNAQAWDNGRKLLFYMEEQTGNLYVWEQTDDGTPDDDHTFLGNVDTLAGPALDLTPADRSVRGASFANDIYYFVVDGTWDLWQVTFSSFAPVTISTVSMVGSMTIRGGAGWTFGDIAVTTGGTLYGSGQRHDPPNSAQIEFFRYNITAVPVGDFISIRSEDASAGYFLSEIAFLSDQSQLFAIHPNTSNAYFVDISDGTYTLINAFPASPFVRFRDIGGGSCCEFPVELQRFWINQ